MSKPLLAITTALLLTLITPSAEARSSKLKCLEDGRTVAANAQVRVFYRGDAHAHVLYACWVKDRRIRTLGETSRDTRDEYGIQNPVLAGRRVAFSGFTCVTERGCSSTVRVVDVRTNRTVALDPESRRNVFDLVLTSRGVAAFIEAAGGRMRVAAVGAQGRTVLDEAERIELGSLAVRGSRVFWMRAGMPQSVVL